MFDLFILCTIAYIAICIVVSIFKSLKEGVLHDVFGYIYHEIIGNILTYTPVFVLFAFSYLGLDMFLGENDFHWQLWFVILVSVIITVLLYASDGGSVYSLAAAIGMASSYALIRFTDLTDFWIWGITILIVIVACIVLYFVPHHSYVKFSIGEGIPFLNVIAWIISSFILWQWIKYYMVFFAAQ